jgi:hypothetical protein
MLSQRHMPAGARSTTSPCLATTLLSQRLPNLPPRWTDSRKQPLIHRAFLATLAVQEGSQSKCTYHADFQQ